MGGCSPEPLSSGTTSLPGCAGTGMFPLQYRAMGTGGWQMGHLILCWVQGRGEHFLATLQGCWMLRCAP